MTDECQLAFEEIASMILPDVWPPLPTTPDPWVTAAAFAFGLLCGAALLAAARQRTRAARLYHPVRLLRTSEERLPATADTTGRPSPHTVQMVAGGPVQFAQVVGVGPDGRARAAEPGDRLVARAVDDFSEGDVMVIFNGTAARQR